ncbi:MAG: hypothetical protein HKN33_17600 [Pyrinomonadaceae bacterium]|nr:hypothetical protein [Pyrinomonadaceae bacterium]
MIDLVLMTEKLYEPPALFVHNMKAGGRKAPTDCMMIRKEYAKRIGIFEEEFRHIGEDQIAWAKLTLNGRIYVMDEVLARYRLHPDSITAVESRSRRADASAGYFFNWLDEYLETQRIDSEKVLDSVRRFKRKAQFEARLGVLKRLYQKTLPLHIRYKLRDKVTKMKKALSRSTHWHE